MSDRDPEPEPEPEYALWNINGEWKLIKIAGKYLADQRLRDQALQHYAAENEQLRKPTYKEVYARYRRRHAKNPKVTIREVCEEMGVDYDNIRAAKSRATKREKPSQKRHRRSKK